ncbi:hypothetical protein PIB30_101014 [Stylosanthes scabra]|uniref:Uncharacterized protein n=1 Tax=Stylosanthes scabra TaxID=79078 RepID=A0ABU6XY12_9FABA|nr:hypothetical protein [Stylosanthes scabra]
MGQEPHFLLSKPLDNIFAGIHESNRFIGHTNERLDSQRVSSGVAMLSLRVQIGLPCDETRLKGTTTPIERSILFATKFPDQIIDKQQLQRFLGCLNYGSDTRCPEVDQGGKGEDRSMQMMQQICTGKDDLDYSYSSGSIQFRSLIETDCNSSGF